MLWLSDPEQRLVMTRRMMEHAAWVRSFVHQTLTRRSHALGEYPPPRGAARVEVAAHRGASATFPENTHAAFEGAWARRLEGIELDVRRTKDDKVVVIHDNTLRRTCPPSANVNNDALLDTPIHELLLEEIRKVPVGEIKTEDSSKFEFIPLLEEVLARTPLDKAVYVEVKGVDPRLFELAGDIGRAYDGPGKINFIAFDFMGLCSVKRRCPDHDSWLVAKTFPYLTSEYERMKTIIDQCAEAGLDGVDFAADTASIDAAVVGYAHDRGLKFGVWKCPWHEEDAFLWSHMVRAGVDVITSNLPPGFDEWHQAAQTTE